MSENTSSVPVTVAKIPVRLKLGLMDSFQDVRGYKRILGKSKHQCGGYTEKCEKNQTPCAPNIYEA
jgi:hypothetical protein